MPIMQLISQFAELEKELHEAVRVNDGERIEIVDRQIESAFSQLLEYEPTNADDRRQKCAFLIDRLCPADNRQGIEQTICERILALVSVDDEIKLQQVTAK